MAVDVEAGKDLGVRVGIQADGAGDLVFQLLEGFVSNNILRFAVSHDDLKY